MKLLILAATTILFSNPALSSEFDSPICQKMYAEAEATCEKVLCDEAEADGYSCDNFDGDWVVAHQECTWGEFEMIIHGYNEDHPNTKLTCEDF